MRNLSALLMSDGIRRWVYPLRRYFGPERVLSDRLAELVFDVLDVLLA